MSWLGVPELATTATRSPILSGSAGTTWCWCSERDRGYPLVRGELPHLGDATPEEVSTSYEIAHVAFVDFRRGSGDRIVAMGFQVRRPGIERPDVMLVHDLKFTHRKAGGAGEFDDILGGGHLPARKYLLTDEPHEPQIAH